MALRLNVLVRIGQAALALTSDELDLVTIVYVNPDFGGPNSLIECNGHWADYKQKRFYGDSLIECLEKAVEEKKRFNEKP